MRIFRIHNIWYTMAIKSFLKRIGKLEPFEIRNNSLMLCLISPGIYVYSLLIFQYNTSATEIPYLREVFAILFLVVGLLPLTKNKFIIDYYGVFVFVTLMLFLQYLTYTVALNKFSIDYLLGTYIVMFGGVLMLNNRLLIIVFSALQLLHMGYRVITSDLDIVAEGAILISTTTIFIYSFIILNGSIRYRKNLLDLNVMLEDKVDERTKALENRAKELYERNKDLEEFAYAVSHDLKQPLRNIYTLTEWCEDLVKEEDEEMGATLQKMKIQTEKMDLLIEGVLNYSLQMNKEKELKEIDVDVMLREMIAINTNTHCKIILKNAMPTIVFNESQLIQVFQNLIQNAIKHNHKEEVRIEIESEEREKDHVFSIKDNGPGIESKYFEKIFQLFQRLDVHSNGGKVGIGLALVKKIVERRGGQVWVESVPGKGATFFFTIKKMRLGLG